MENNRTPEEELEYRRYLQRRIRKRKRRKQVMIARTVVAAVALGLVFLLFFGIGKLVGGLTGSSGKKEVKKDPVVTPFVVDVPEGYEEIYQKLYGFREEYDQLDDILLSMERYPKDILQMLSGNLETIDFVSDYLKHVDDEEASGRIEADELQEEGIPLFQQWDKRWGYVTYGNNIIAINGCGPTCMSMVYTGLTEKSDMTPADMADFCIENDYFSQESGTSWSLMLNGAKKLGLESERIEISTKTIKSRLKEGQVVIASMQPGDFTTTGHFIVLTGISPEGKLLLNDPNSMANSEKEWEFETVVKQIKAAWSYTYSN